MEIIVNGIEYANEKEAKKAMAKARKEEKESRRKADLLYAEARRNAEHSFYQIVMHAERMKDGNKDNWSQYEPDVQIVPMAIGREYRVKYMTQWGTVQFDHYGYVPVSVIDSVEGNIAVKIRNVDIEESYEWYGIGVSETMIYLIDLPKSIYPELDRIKVWNRRAA